MITAVLFMLFLGLIVFGPKKTVEIAQTVGRLLVHLKSATGQFQTQIEQELSTQERNGKTGGELGTDATFPVYPGTAERFPQEDGEPGRWDPTRVSGGGWRVGKDGRFRAESIPFREFIELPVGLVFAGHRDSLSTG